MLLLLFIIIPFNWSKISTHRRPLLALLVILFGVALIIYLLIKFYDQAKKFCLIAFQYTSLSTSILYRTTDSKSMPYKTDNNFVTSWFKRPTDWIRIGLK